MTKLEKHYYDQICELENDNLLFKTCIKQRDIEIGKLKSEIDELNYLNSKIKEENKETKRIISEIKRLSTIIFQKNQTIENLEEKTKE